MKGRGRTAINLKINRGVYDDLKAVALRKKIKVNDALEEAAQLYVKEFDKALINKAE